MNFLILIAFLLVSYGNFASSDDVNKIVAKFPLQFSASVEIFSHLVSETSEFPPNVRRMTIFYDYVNKKARAEIEAGFEAAKYYIRRYDTKNEYMVRLPPIDDCKRSHLGETMPEPDLTDVVFVKEEVVDGILCNYFVMEDFNTRVHVYLAKEDSAPVKLIEENYENGVSTPLLTYTYSDVVLGPPDDSWFELTEPFEHKKCTRHISGFPYLHVFHWFVRF